MKTIFRIIIYSFCLSFLTINYASAATVVLPHTGQTTCYDFYNTLTTCAGTGQDGDKLKGVAWPNPRFTDNGNGTVTDNLTGLIWLKDPSCHGAPNWADALTAAQSLANNICNLTDGSTAGQWRLPSITELSSLVDLSNASPALPTGHPFLNVPLSGFLSSTSCFGLLSGSVWYVNMDLGYVESNAKNLYGYVWPVRGGL